MTFTEFCKEMERLEGLKFGPPNLRTHWDALNDLSLESIQRGISAGLLLWESYPSPAEMREAVARSEPRIDGPDEHRAEPCEKCADTGWERIDQRSVKRCICWEINPVLKRKREKMAQFATQRTVKAS